MRVFLLACFFFSSTVLHGLPALGADTEEITQELQQAQRDMQKVLSQLQEKAAAGGITPDRLEAVRAKVMLLASNQEFLQAATDLWNHPKRKTLLWADLAFFVMMFFVKAWRQAKARNWFSRALMGFGLSLITWFGLVFALPAIILGRPFHVFIGTLWRVLTG